MDKGLVAVNVIDITVSHNMGSKLLDNVTFNISLTHILPHK
jgi:hypothetical protein